MLFLFARKIVKYFVIVILFITTFLLGFLLIGCSDTSSIYSNVYLTRFQFNQKGFNSSSIPKVTLDVGYLSYCVQVKGNTTCSGFSGIDDLGNSNGITINPIPDHKESLNMAKISKQFNVVCHASILMTTIIITIVNLLLMCYLAIPIFPGKSIAKKIVCFVAFCNLIIWGLGSMLQHEAVMTAKQIVGPSSFGLVVVKSGSRAEAITWTAFTFILLVFMFSIVNVLADLREKKKSIVNTKV